MVKTQILLIENNRLLREGISAMLNSCNEFEVVAEFEESDADSQLVNLTVTPDIVLLELGLEKSNSLKLMAQLHEIIPEAKIVAMDILPDHVDIFEFVMAGGSGFILKNAPREDWIKTIKTVATGENVIEYLESAALQQKAVFGIEASALSAETESGATLYVEEDYHVQEKSGRTGQPHIPFKEELTEDIFDDAVDIVIDRVLKKGGNVIFVKSGLMKNLQKIALVRSDRSVKYNGIIQTENAN